ncbi:MAG: LysM peptidoglycan-binding domain-containing protein [Cellulosilyticaceae bacterium]
MGKIIYEPKEEKESGVKEQVSGGNLPQSEGRYNALIESIDSVRPVGDTQCEYGVYLEDYAYTYTYQYAATDLGCEHSGILLGEYYKDTKEMIICGMMPIPKSLLEDESDWISEQAIKSLMSQKEKYFPTTKVLGWFHMQPGYGTMLTMKEVKIQRDLFDQEGTVLLLIDPINKIETFYAYEGDTLKEQTGYFLYYDKNPSMQQYMLDNPFFEAAKEEVDDSAVYQFREIGKIRKKEYQQRKRTNFTVVAASLAILALGAVVIKMADQSQKLKNFESQLAAGQSVQASSGQVENEGNGLNEEEVQFIVNGTEGQEQAAGAENETSGEETTGVKLVDNTKPNLTPNQTPVEEVEEVEDAPEEAEAPVQAADKETEVVAEETDVEDEDYITYKVQEGDTLRKISYDHYETEKRAREIITLNELENGDQIYVGQTLKLPQK